VRLAFDHRGDEIAHERAITRDQVGRGAVTVEHVLRDEVDDLREDVQAGLLLDRQKRVLGMQRHGVDLPGDEPGEPPGGALRDELGVVDREAGFDQRLAPDPPVEAADAAAGGGEPLALEIREGLDAFRHQIGLRRFRGQSPDLADLHAAADLDVVDGREGVALGQRHRRGRRGAAVELDDVGVDAVPGEDAELLCHIGGGVHHVGRGDGDADIDLAHGGTGLRGGGTDNAREGESGEDEERPDS